eukprot:19812_4
MAAAQDADQLKAKNEQLEQENEELKTAAEENEQLKRQLRDQDQMRKELAALKAAQSNQSVEDTELSQTIERKTEELSLASYKTAHFMVGKTPEEAFAIFDRDQNGFISAEELRYIVSAKTGQQLSDAEAKTMIANADVNKDGRISYAEFEKVWVGQETSADAAIALLVKLRIPRPKAQMVLDLLAPTEELLLSLASAEGQEAALLRMFQIRGTDALRTVGTEDAAQAFVAAALVEHINLSPELAGEIAAVVVLRLDTALDCVDDPISLLPKIVEWSEVVVDEDLDTLSELVRGVVLTQVETTVQNPRLKTVAQQVLSSFRLTRPQLALLLAGDLEELLSQLLHDVAETIGEAAVDEIDRMTMGLQKKAEKAADMALRVEKAIENSSLATDLIQQALEAGSELPVVGTAVKLVRAIFAAADGAKANKEQCAAFRQLAERVRRILLQARKTPGIEAAVAEVESLLRKGLDFVESLGGKGFVRRLLSNKSDDRKLKELSAQLSDAVQQMETEFIFAKLTTANADAAQAAATAAAAAVSAA